MGLGEGEHVFEHGRAVCQQTLVDAELNVARNKDDRPVLEPQLLIPLHYSFTAGFLDIRVVHTRTLSCWRRRHFGETGSGASEV